jgi:hypothetical protein
MILRGVRAPGMTTCLWSCCGTGGFACLPVSLSEPDRRNRLSHKRELQGCGQERVDTDGMSNRK